MSQGVLILILLCVLVVGVGIVLSTFHAPRPSVFENPADPSLRCHRCDVPLHFLGERDFHEGPRWGVAGDLAELLVAKEGFDVYACPRCGSVEMFIAGVGERADA